MEEKQLKYMTYKMILDNKQRNNEGEKSLFWLRGRQYGRGSMFVILRNSAEQPIYRDTLLVL